MLRSRVSTDERPGTASPPPSNCGGNGIEGTTDGLSTPLLSGALEPIPCPPPGAPIVDTSVVSRSSETQNTFHFYILRRGFMSRSSQHKTFIQSGPTSTLYKYYRNVLCLLVCVLIQYFNGQEPEFISLIICYFIGCTTTPRHLNSCFNMMQIIKLDKYIRYFFDANIVLNKSSFLI